EIVPVMTGLQFLDVLSAPYEAFPGKQLRGKDIVFIGNGDMAYASIMQFLGMDIDTGAQTTKTGDRYGKMTWVVPPGEFRDPISVDSPKIFDISYFLGFQGIRFRCLDGEYT